MDMMGMWRTAPFLDSNRYFDRRPDRAGITDQQRSARRASAGCAIAGAGALKPMERALQSLDGGSHG
jgi:hypothetical protein